MCYLCEEAKGETVNCQGCGNVICFDTEFADDIDAPAYVTESGDLYCLSCGRRHDEAEEEEDDYYPYPDDEEFDESPFAYEDDWSDFDEDEA